MANLVNYLEGICLYPKKEQSRTMKNFIFKSTAADLQKMFQLIETIQKNVLYVTYRIDMLIKRYDKLEIDKGLQQQVDQYFEETSPQTDTDNKDD